MRAAVLSYRCAVRARPSGVDVQGLRSSGLALAFAALVSASCFDSDQKLQGPPVGTTGEDDTTTTTTSTSTDTTGDLPGSSSTGTPPFTCEDAIACMVACGVQLGLSMDPEPDLSCLIDCVEEKLTVSETVDLLRLINCASDQCKELGACSSGATGTDDTGTSTGDSSSSSTSDGGGGSGALIDPCIDCIILYIQDESAPGCEEYANACE